MSETLLHPIGGRIACMRLPVALAFCIALSLPAWAQHQAGTNQNGGAPVGHPGTAARGAGQFRGAPHGTPAPRPSYSQRAPGYSGLTGLQAPSSFSAPGLFPTPARPEPPARTVTHLPWDGTGFWQGDAQGRDHQGGDRNRGHDGDRDGHHRRHRRDYVPGYVYAYPYPVDPGYDWAATDYSESEQAPYADGPSDQNSGYGPEAPQGAYAEAPDAARQPSAAPSSAPAEIGPQVQEYHFAASPASKPSPFAPKPLTVIFKGGRAPQKMQNYMVTSTALTNLDGEHFENIPLDQIDIAATQQANKSSGIDFHVPSPARD